MKGDFSRRTFDPHRHFSRVLMQQGRVLLDADWNEQVSILLHYLRSAVADFGGPVAPIGSAFKITTRPAANGNPKDNDFLIEPGHLYVGGVLCENDRVTAYTEQPDYPIEDQPRIERTHLVYLDVWERHITHVQDSRIREIALGGPDTTTRARVTWQVKLHQLNEGTTCAGAEAIWLDLVEEWQAQQRGTLLARTKEPSGFATDDPCITPPEARYRGTANRLYRVEIHRGGLLGQATFKWSRENGAVVFPIRSLAGSIVYAETLGSDDSPSVTPGSWVEVLDDHAVLRGEPGQLAEVGSIDPVERSLKLQPAGGSMAQSFDEDSATHPIVRRWDYRHGVEDGGSEAPDGALMVEEDTWTTLEDGIEVRFAPPAGDGTRHTYRTGDYWLFPARTETGDVEWPNAADGSPEVLGPHGVRHHYARLAVISLSEPAELEDCLESLRERRG